MTIHAICQYLRYRWRAQGRHGTHSPFVYRFVEEVLRPPLRWYTWSLLPYLDCNGGLCNMPHRAVTRRVLRYFDPPVIVPIYRHYLEPEPELVMYKSAALEGSHPILFPRRRGIFNRMIYLLFVAPQDWQTAISQLAIPPSTDDFIVIDGIHQVRAATDQWNALRARADVTLSIDLFETGLLFFSKELKAKQHFTLR